MRVSHPQVLDQPARLLELRRHRGVIGEKRQVGNCFFYLHWTPTLLPSPSDVSPKLAVIGCPLVPCTAHHEIEDLIIRQSRLDQQTVQLKELVRPLSHHDSIA